MSKKKKSRKAVQKHTASGGQKAPEPDPHPRRRFRTILVLVFFTIFGVYSAAVYHLTDGEYDIDATEVERALFLRD